MYFRGKKCVQEENSNTRKQKEIHMKYRLNFLIFSSFRQVFFPEFKKKNQNTNIK